MGGRYEAPCGSRESFRGAFRAEIKFGSVMWMDEILHFETMASHCLLVFVEESSFQGFLDGAGFCPSTVFFLQKRVWKGHQGAHIGEEKCKRAPIKQRVEHRHVCRLEGFFLNRLVAQQGGQQQLRRGLIAGLWDQGASPPFCDTRESPFI